VAAARRDQQLRGARGAGSGIVTGPAGTSGAGEGRGGADGRGWPRVGAAVPARLALAVVAGAWLAGVSAWLAGVVATPSLYMEVPVPWTTPGLSAMPRTVTRWPAVSVSRTANGPLPAPDCAIQ